MCFFQFLGNFSKIVLLRKSEGEIFCKNGVIYLDNFFLSVVLKSRRRLKINSSGWVKFGKIFWSRKTSGLIWKYCGSAQPMGEALLSRVSADWSKLLTHNRWLSDKNWPQNHLQFSGSENGHWILTHWFPVSDKGFPPARHQWQTSDFESRLWSPQRSLNHWFKTKRSTVYGIQYTGLLYTVYCIYCIRYTVVLPKLHHLTQTASIFRACIGRAA